MPLGATRSDGGAHPVRERNQCCVGGGLWLDWPLIRRILAQRIVDAVLMIIADVIANQAAKMLLIQRDDVVEDLSATTADPSLRGSVLPGRLAVRPFGLQPFAFRNVTTSASNFESRSRMA